jgi:hypothetical protein
MPVGTETPSTSVAPQTCPPIFLPEKEKAHAMGFEKTPGTNMVSPSTVTPCLNAITHIWLKNKSRFWAKPIAVDENLITCWIWNGTTWHLSQIKLNSVECFLCKWF